MLLKDHAAKIAKDASNNASIGIDVLIPIITTLLPMLLQCFQGTQSNASAKEYLQDHYDANTDEFDSILIKRARPAARRAARKNGQPHLSKPDLDAITVASFRRGLEESDQDVASAMAEAATIPDVEVVDG